MTVVKCEDLPVKDTTLMTCDPYVKLQLLPDKQQRVKTRVLRHTRQPVYDEDFTFYGIQPNQIEVSATSLHTHNIFSTSSHPLFSYQWSFPIIIAV